MVVHSGSLGLAIVVSFPYQINGLLFTKCSIGRILPQCYYILNSQSIVSMTGLIGADTSFNMYDAKKLEPCPLFQINGYA
jgi:hypothetical protein